MPHGEDLYYSLYFSFTQEEKMCLLHFASDFFNSFNNFIVQI